MTAEIEVLPDGDVSIELRAANGMFVDGGEFANIDEVEEFLLSFKEESGADGGDENVENPASDVDGGEQTTTPGEPSKPAKAENSQTQDTSEPATVENVAEKYADFKDNNGIFQPISNIKAVEDRPAAKEYNSKRLKEIVDSIYKKYEDGELPVKEAIEELSALVQIYNKDTPFAILPADEANTKPYKVKKYLSEMKKKLQVIAAQNDTDAANAKAQARAEAIKNAKDEAKKVFDDYMGEPKSDYTKAEDALKKVRDNLVEKLSSIGVGELKKGEIKDVYGDYVKKLSAEHSRREAAAAKAAREEELRKQREVAANANAQNKKEEKKKPTAKDKLKDKLEKIADFIKSLFEMSGEDISLKKKSLAQTADNLSNPGSTPYTETQRMVLRLAKSKAQKAIELAEIQAEAKEAKAKVVDGTAKVNDYINNAMNLRPVDEDGNVESDTFGYEAITAELANNILNTFNEEEQDIIVEYNTPMEVDGDSYVLDAMALDLINNFDDEDTLDLLISEYSKDEDSEFHEFLTTTYTKATEKELDTITKYMNRLAQALKKINNLGAAEDAFKKADKELEKAIQKESKEKPSDAASVVGKSAEQRVKEFDALKAEIDDVFDKETGKVDAQKKFKLLAKADELRKIPNGFNTKDADKVLDAYDEFRDELDARTNEGVANKQFAEPQFLIQQSEKALEPSEEEVSRFFDDAFAHVEREPLTIRPLTKQEIEAIKKTAGFDVRGYKHVLNANGIRHSWNNHGKGHERKKDNIPLSREDYNRYIDTLDAPTRITKGNASNRGEFTVKYIKEYPDGTMYIVELLSGENKTLQTKTIWKKQPLGGGRSVKNNSSHTSGTGTNAAISSTNDSIAQEKEKGQQLISLIRNAGVRVVTNKVEMERVLGEEVQKASDDDVIQKLVISYPEGTRVPDLTLVKQTLNGKDMYGVAFVGEKPKGYVPKKIGKAYKLMELYPDGTLHALFAGVEKSHKLGNWNWAQGFTPDEKGGVKTMSLAPRYGWHMGTGVPASYHLMGVGDTLNPQMVYPTKQGIGHPKGSKRVWVEVHYDATNDYTDVAESNPGREKDIRGLVPFGGYYMFQEGNLSNWIIASGIKFDHVLSDEERQRILVKAGYNEELVWRKQVLSGKLKAQITSDSKKIAGEKALSKGETLEFVEAHKREIEKIAAENEKRIKELNDGKDWKYKKRSDADLRAERERIRKAVFNNPESQAPQFLRTSRGEVYGFVKDGKIYIDIELLDANTPVHEYTHIWDKAVREKNPELWNKGVELLKQTELWSDVVNDVAYQNIKDDENLVASEVHSRLTGKNSEKILKNINASNGVVNALKQWLNDFWTFLKDTFAPWSKNELNSLTIEEFVAMPIGDLVKGTKLGNVRNSDGKTLFSARSKSHSQDLGITGINEAYKNKLEEAYAAGAGDNRITAIMNEHQKALGEYLKQKGKAQKERAKIRAQELRQLRKDFKAGKIDSYEVGGVTIVRGKNGVEAVKEVTEKLPTRKYVSKRHEGEKPANAAQKLGSKIAREEPKTRTQKVKEWILNAKGQFYKHFVDKYDALHLLDDAIAKASGKKIDGANTILGRMNMVANSASGMAMALLEGNADELKQAANKYGIKNMVSLQMLMEKIGKDMKAGRFADYVKSTNPQGKAELEERISAIENYLVARSLLESAQNHRLDYDRSVAEWEKKGSHGDKPIFEPYKFPGGMTEQEIRQVIREAPVGFKEYAKMFKGITNNMLDILYNTGLITGDRYLATKSRYKAYCPLMRDFSDTAAVDSFIDQINSGKGLANVSAPLKNRSSEGSERDIVPPLRTIVTSINALTQKAERNRVGQYAVKQASKYKLDDYIKEVKGNSGDAKNCIFTVMFNGEKHSYQTIPEMYPAITAAVEPLVKIEMALLTKPAQWLRTGSTMSPSFILRNLIRDTLFAGIASKNGFVPIYDSIRGMNALLNNQRLRSEFNASGVISSNFYGDGESVMRSLESMAGGKKWQELGLLDIIKGIFHKPIEGLEWISNLAEAGTRMGEFMRAREKGKSVDQAAYDAVEITLNFGRSGATGQQINRMVPFFNACIQGGDKLYRMYKADPRRTLLRIGTYIVLPSIVLWLWNHDEDWYKELDPNVKMTNWILPNGIRIPKPQEAGILFGSGAEAMLDTANGQDPKAMANWRTQARDALMPGVIPTLFLPLAEWITNYSFFRGKPIVSKSQERLPDELQYGPYTSEMSKALGDNPIMKLSPVKIDNLWRGYTGTMGMFLWQAPDLLIAEKRNLPEKKLSEMAFVRDFVVNDMNLTRTMNDFYQLKEASAKWQAGYGKKGKPTAAVSGVNTAANTISKLQKEIRDITTNPKYTPAQKRMLVDKNRAKQQKVAQLCLKKYGDKFDI